MFAGLQLHSVHVVSKLMKFKATKHKNYIYEIRSSGWRGDAAVPALCMVSDRKIIL